MYDKFNSKNKKMFLLSLSFKMPIMEVSPEAAIEVKDCLRPADGLHNEASENREYEENDVGL
jgi:hypothetical protein